MKPGKNHPAPFPTVPVPRSVGAPSRRPPRVCSHADGGRDATRLEITSSILPAGRRSKRSRRPSTRRISPTAPSPCSICIVSSSLVGKRKGHPAKSVRGGLATANYRATCVLLPAATEIDHFSRRRIQKQLAVVLLILLAIPLPAFAFVVEVEHSVYRARLRVA
jgi:hypothetical protein